MDSNRGADSARFGRRSVLLFSTFGLAIDYLVMALAPNLALLFVGRMLSGVTAATVFAARAYVVDISPPAERARNSARILAATNIGIVAGPAIGGAVGAFDARAPFWVAAALALINGGFVWVMLPESLPRDRRKPFRWASANLLGSATILFGRARMAGLAATLFICEIGQVSFLSVFQYYTHFRFHWNAPEIGLFLTGMGFLGIFVQTVLSGFSVERWGERGAVLVGLVLCAVGFATQGLASQVWLFWVGALVMIVGSINMASMASLMAQRVNADEQGRLQSAAMLSLSATSLVGPTLFATVFAWSIGGGSWLHLPGLTFLLGSGAYVIALSVAYFTAHPIASSPAGENPLLAP